MSKNDKSKNKNKNKNNKKKHHHHQQQRQQQQQQQRQQRQQFNTSHSEADRRLALLPSPLGSKRIHRLMGMANGFFAILPRNRMISKKVFIQGFLWPRNISNTKLEKYMRKKSGETAYVLFVDVVMLLLLT